MPFDLYLEHLRGQLSSLPHTLKVSMVDREIIIARSRTVEVPVETIEHFAGEAGFEDRMREVAEQQLCMMTIRNGVYEFEKQI